MAIRLVASSIQAAVSVRLTWNCDSQRLYWVDILEDRIHYFGTGRRLMGDAQASGSSS